MYTLYSIVVIFSSYYNSNQIKSQIKSLLLSHHHSTSALVSEILMSVLQTVQKNNRQFTYGQTVQKTTDNLHMDRQCKKLHWSIYSAPDSAKKTTTAIYIWTDSAKKQQQFTYGQTVQKSNSNLHMDSTYFTSSSHSIFSSVQYENT